jgi:shikimate kinase
MKKNLVFLTGFMASGKSTIGPILANTLGWNFIDLDQLIEEYVGKKIKLIFDENGEEFFRNIERKKLLEILNLNKYIIALGGGTIADPINLEMIKTSGFLIYLESSPEEAYKRLRFKRDRPVLLFEGEQEPNKTEFLLRINELLKKRKKYYDQANIKINTDNSRIGKTVDRLALIINKEIKSEITKS